MGNPCRFTVGGADVLSYHGKSIDDMVMNLRETSYENPESAMKQMLKRRHLAPQWGVKNQIASEPTDMLTIESTPDIFVTGAYTWALYRKTSRHSTYRLKHMARPDFISENGRL